MPGVSLEPGQIDPHSRRIRHVIGLDLQPVNDVQVRAARRAYYGAVSYVDERIGQILGVLGETGLAQDTIVLLIADHGDMLGERGLWYKMGFFEPACRIPLIVHAPGRFAAHRVAESASLLDLLPTLCDLGGADLQGSGVSGEGRSLVSAMRGGPGPDEVLGEYLAEGAIAPIVMIRRDRWKFIHSPVDPDQLFDLVSDPRELHNLAAEPAHRQRVAQFRQEVARRWDLPALNQAVRASQRRRIFVNDALRTGHCTSWDYQPPYDASRKFIRNSLDLPDLEARARLPGLTVGRPGR